MLEAQADQITLAADNSTGAVPCRTGTTGNGRERNCAALFLFFLGGYQSYLGIVAAIVTLAFYAPFALQCFQDYFGPPITVRGAFTKQKRQVRGPPHYYLTCGIMQIRTSKQVWQQIAPDQVYDICMPRTRSGCWQLWLQVLQVIPLA